jgi:tetratricopeptide (TPR) repeat protein
MLSAGRLVSLLLAKQSISDEKSIKKDNLSIGLSNIGSNLQLPLGAFRNAESNLVRAFELAKETKNEFHEAVCQEALSHLLFYIGKWDEAEQKSLIALEFFEKMKETQGQSSTLAYYALQFLQKNRDNAQASIQNGKLAIQFASRALELAEEIARTASPISRDLIRTHWLLGASYLLNNQFNLAEQHLSEALTRDRISNMVDHEANILLELARLRYSQKNYEESKTHAEEALSITERCGYVLQGADVNLFLAQYALEQEKDKAKAKQYAEEAKQLATCDGPPYYYKVAYEEAEAMLKKLG